MKTPSPSIFRPDGGVDQSALKEHKALIEDIDRRKILRGTVSLGALTMLTGCNVTHTDAVQSVLKRISQFNDKVQELLFRPNHLAPTFSESQVVKPPRFNAYYDIEDIAPVNVASWKLELAGKIKDKRSWTAQQIYALPEQEWIVRHVCVEGWDYIGQWSGVNLREFLERIGADLTDRRRPHGKICLVQMRRRLLRLDRHGDRAAPADDTRNEIRQRADHRSIRISLKAAYRNQARLQEPEMDHRDRSHQRVPRRLLGGSRLQLVQRDLARRNVSARRMNVVAIFHAALRPAATLPDTFDMPPRRQR